jgi:hypothetical protein
MLNAPYCYAESTRLRRRASRWSSALLLAAACAGRSGTEELPAASLPIEPAFGSSEVQVPLASQRETLPDETRSLSWAVPAGGSRWD